MPTLSGKQTGKLNGALDDAFDSVDALDDFLWEMLDKRLHNLAIASDARILRSKLIRKADSQGWVLDLIAAACQARPTNVAMRDIAAEVGLSHHAVQAALGRHGLGWEAHTAKRHDARERAAQVAAGLGFGSMASYLGQRRAAGWTWRAMSAESGQPESWLRRQAGG